jgi:hypothetical protein
MGFEPEEELPYEMRNLIQVLVLNETQRRVAVTAGVLLE